VSGDLQSCIAPALLGEALDAGLLVLDRTPRVLFANEVAARLLGITSAQLQGVTSFDGLWDLVRGDGTPFPLQELPGPTAARTGQAVRDVLLGAARKQHERSWLLVSAIPAQPGADGKPERIVVTLRDVTALQRGLSQAQVVEKRLTEGLGRAQRREAMGELAAGVAHNMSNMLAAVLPNLENLRRAMPESPEVLDSIAAARKGAELVRQLQEFARGDARQASGPVQLAAVVDDVVKLCRSTFDPSILFDVDLAARHAVIEGSPGLVQQAVLNLLLNARDAMEGVPDKRLRLRLTLHEGPVPGQPKQEGERHCALEVSDTGCGMDEATQRRLGEPFFTTKPQGRGTGLGLAAVLGALQAMRGTFAVRSTPGEGTQVTLRFGASTPKPRVPSQPRPALSPARVLVVDDEPLVRRTLRRVLESVGMHVTEAENGERALEMLAERPLRFDAVLLDLSMPGLSGLDVLARLRPLLPELPVLLLSGDIGPGVPPGADAALQKPVLLKELHAVLGAALAKKRG
jgi:signal transduction histidine kinase